MYACPDCNKELQTIEDLEEKVYVCRGCGVEYSADELLGLSDVMVWDGDNVDELPI